MAKFITKLTVFIISLLASTLFAQNFQGEAIYQSKRFMDEATFKITGSNQDPAFEKELQESLAKAFEKTYELHFNVNEDLYQEQEKLEAPQQAGGAMMSISFGSEKSYRNRKDKTLIEEEEFFSKEFLVSDSLSSYAWTMLPDTKKIGQYACYKAMVTIPVSAEQLADYEKRLAEQEKNKTQLLTLKAPEDRVIEAWYAPEIPVNTGPATYWGLPGLIMEVHDGDVVYLCTKVTLNPKNAKKIEKPKKGKKVSRKEYKKIMEEKFESMKDGNGNIMIETIIIGG
ncbi:MAG: GLPGLI family protein [Flavobacterium sp.]